MFSQFISQAEGPQVYLITSLAIFLVFFIVVTLLLFSMRKQHISYMSDMPLHDSIGEHLTTAAYEN